MNLPFDTIHDINHSYGRIILPLPGGRVLAWFQPMYLPVSKVVVRRRRLYFTKSANFHNCRATGIY